jgi:hypothetical protein
MFGARSPRLSRGTRTVSGKGRGETEERRARRILVDYWSPKLRGNKGEMANGAQPVAIPREAVLLFRGCVKRVQNEDMMEIFNADLIIKH